MLAISPFVKQSAIDKSGNLFEFRPKKVLLIKFQFVCPDFIFFFGKIKADSDFVAINLGETFLDDDSIEKSHEILNFLFFISQPFPMSLATASWTTILLKATQQKKQKSVHWTLNLIWRSSGCCRKYLHALKDVCFICFFFQINWFLWPDPRFRCKLLALSFQSIADRSC